MTSNPVRHNAAVPSDPKQHARMIAEAVDQAWHSHYGGSGIEVPISVVAALALLPQPADPADPAGAVQMTHRMGPEGFAAAMSFIWCQFAVARPDLAARTKPLWRWIDEGPDESVLRAVHATGKAALSKGLLDLTGVPEGRRGVDVLASVLQAMRSRSAREARGQFLTPECLTELIGRMTAPQAGKSVMDPCAGTGTMLLGAAKAMRERGVDPAGAEWWANDIDPLAAACCAVNVHLWDLGPRVVVGCGDGLLNAWTRQALHDRQAGIDEVTAKWDFARKDAAMRDVLGLPRPEHPLRRYVREALPPPPKAPPPHSATFDPDAAYRQGALF